MIFAMDIVENYWNTIGELARSGSVLFVAAGTAWVAFRKWRNDERKAKLRTAVGIKDGSSDSPIEDIVMSALSEARGNIDAVTAETLEAVKNMKQENATQHADVAGRIDGLTIHVNDLKSQVTTHIAEEAHVTDDLNRLERGLERIEDHLLRNRDRIA